MRIGIVGCAGRMGRANLRQVLLAAGGEGGGVTLAGGVERPGHPALGQDLGVLAGLDPAGAVAGDDLGALLAASDAVIEFSTPDATVATARLAAAAGGCAHVVGTTGLGAAEAAELRACAARVPIVWAPNMSLGVNLLLGLVERAAAALDAAGWDVEILEMHHRHKVDAPSGTALALGEAAARGRGVALAEAAVRVRDSVTGPRAQGTIGFATLRGGDVVGDHRVILAGSGERVELAHVATDRGIYAAGALRAARWTEGRAPGLYGMADVLGLGGTPPAPAAAAPPSR